MCWSLAWLWNSLGVPRWGGRGRRAGQQRGIIILGHGGVSGLGDPLPSVRSRRPWPVVRHALPSQLLPPCLALPPLPGVTT